MLKKLLTGLSVVLVAVGVLWAADGTWRFPVPGLGGLNAGDLIYAVDGNNLSNKALTNTDGSVFLQAFDVCRSDTTTQQNGLIPVRVATSDWGLARTAAGAETINYVCNLDSWLQRVGTTTGIKVTSLGLVYEVRVANLTSHTFNGVNAVTYATGAASVVGADLNDAVTLRTEGTANYLSTITLTTPAFFPSAANKALNMEGTVVMANLGVFRLYGVNVSFTRTDH